MRVTFLGHATLLLEVNGAKIIVDPFITGNEKASGVDLNAIEVDYMLITHAHQDHVLDVPTIAQNNPNAVLISNYEIGSYFNAKHGIPFHPMNTGGEWSFDFGKVKSVVALHSSSFADGAYGGCPNGYLIADGNRNIYIAGDTALTQDMKLIPSWMTLDLAVLPVGNNFTMGVEDAAVAAEFVKCNRVLGYHYDTFGYIEIDHEASKKHFSDNKKELILLDINQSIEI